MTDGTALKTFTEGVNIFQTNLVDSSNNIEIATGNLNKTGKKFTETFVSSTRARRTRTAGQATRLLGRFRFLRPHRLLGVGPVLVSQTVKDRTAGSGIRFEAAGAHELKGMPEPWALYEAMSQEAPAAGFLAPDDSNVDKAKARGADARRRKPPP